MRQAEIEFWALGIVAAVDAGGRVEDSRVELKAKWPDPYKAARRLAGHANAARGEEVLWLLGVDEEQGVAGVNPDDLANWWSSTIANFEGPVPTITPVTIYQSSTTFLALLIETAAAPFVIRNPAFGKGGPVELEVPWRDMTSVRSARHNDLIRLLVPQIKLPVIEVLDGKLVGSRDHLGRITTEFGPGFEWDASITLYIVPRTRELLVFPAHLVSVTVREPVALGELDLQYYGLRSDRTGLYRDPNVDLVVDAPSRVRLMASAQYHEAKAPGDHATIVARLTPAGSDRQIVISCEFDRQEPSIFKLTRSSVSTP